MQRDVRGYVFPSGAYAMAKILVVDDSKFARLTCKKLLLQNGHTVVEGETGAQALALYSSEQPDLTLLDITMPEMDGLTALKEIKRLDPAACVAMVTAMGQQSVIVEALKAGAGDFIVKPFDGERVLATVTKLLG